MRHARSTASSARLALSLFLSFFTAQAGFIVLAPTLPQVAREFGVSVGSAGQLRTVAALAGVGVAVAVAYVARRVATRRILRAGLALLIAGAAVSGAGPTFAAVALGQLIVGAGGAAVVAAGLSAATEWPAPAQRANVLAWTIVGQPAAWVAAMPVIGALAALSWRWSWAVVPVAAVAALVTLPRGTAPEPCAGPRCGESRAWRDPAIRRWALGEVMAFAGWGGTLVYAGALLSESYGLATETVALLLGLAAAAYFPGTFAARRHLERDLRAPLALLALALAAGAVVFGTVRPSPVASTAVFTLLVLLAGARGIIGGAFGINAAPEDKLAIGGLRAAATQLGYLVGAAAGGAALELGGYPALGLVLGAFFTAAALPHLAPLRLRQPLLRFAESTTTSDS